MQPVIRNYRSSDKDAVCSLIRTGTLGNIYPCFVNAMTSPLYIFITGTLSAAGFLLGSMVGALLLPGIWVGLIYYCCHELYSSYVRANLQTDMQDITRSYLSRPGDFFWVAEAKVDGASQIVGTVAVLSNQNGEEKQAELFRLRVSPSFRLMGLGSRLTQTVIDFCKERGITELVIRTSASQTPAVNLYEKLGFQVALITYESQPSFWIVRLASNPVVTMKKHL